MRSHRVIAVLFAGVAAAACGGGDDDGGNGNNQDPVAAFTAPSCTVGVPCQFTDASSDPDGADDIVAWEWDFGDGVVTHTQNPARSYAAAGDKTVELTVTDASGGTSSVQHTVAVAAPNPGGPTADFTVACSGLDCTFTDASTPATGLTYDWDFGDGSAHGTDQNPTHTYDVTEVTEFTATLTVTDASENQSSHDEIFTVSPAAGCGDATDQTIDCTLDITDKSTVVITLTSKECQDGNQFEITAPISEVVFTDGCLDDVGTEYHINNDQPFDAGTQLTFKFTQGAGDPDDPPRVPPQIRVEGVTPGSVGAYPDWTLFIDDGGNSTVQGEPDFNDLVLTVHATAAP
jgi:PKD repeat protein